MNVIVVGGGNTGSYLTKLLLETGQRVVVVEERSSVLEKLKLELPLESIIEGDGSSPTVLEKAGVSHANVLAAVTGSDETNHRNNRQGEDRCNSAAAALQEAGE